jgi:hypothetical protein
VEGLAQQGHSSEQVRAHWQTDCEVESLYAVMLLWTQEEMCA